MGRLSRITTQCADTTDTVSSPTLVPISCLARAARLAVVTGLCAAFLVSATLPSAGAAETKGRDALAITREKLDAAASAASEAAAKLSAVEGDRAPCDRRDRGDRTRDPHPAGTGRRAPGDREGAGRPALHVRGNGPSIDGLIDAESPLQVARASHLSNVAAEHDVSLAAELRARGQARGPHGRAPHQAHRARPPGRARHRDPGRSRSQARDRDDRLREGAGRAGDDAQPGRQLCTGVPRDAVPGQRVHRVRRRLRRTPRRWSGARGHRHGSRARDAGRRRRRRRPHARHRGCRRERRVRGGCRRRHLLLRALLARTRASRARFSPAT